MGMDRAWIRHEAKFEGGQGGKLNAGRQLTNDEMWGVDRAHLSAHGDVLRHDRIVFAASRQPIQKLIVNYRKY